MKYIKKMKSKRDIKALSLFYLHHLKADKLGIGNKTTHICKSDAIIKD